MSIETAKHICREICAYKGEPPCFELDARAGEEYRPCEECEPVAAWHDAEVERLERERDEALEKALGRLTNAAVEMRGVFTSQTDEQWKASSALYEAIMEARAALSHKGDRKG